MTDGKEHIEAMTPEEVLQKWWGYAAFRPKQREIIDAVLAVVTPLPLCPREAVSR